MDFKLDGIPMIKDVLTANGITPPPIGTGYDGFSKTKRNLLVLEPKERMFGN